jgi:hypothetical protein
MSCLEREGKWDQIATCSTIRRLFFTRLVLDVAALAHERLLGVVVVKVLNEVIHVRKEEKKAVITAIVGATGTGLHLGEEVVQRLNGRQAMVAFVLVSTMSKKLVESDRQNSVFCESMWTWRKQLTRGSRMMLPVERHVESTNTTFRILEGSISEIGMES